VSFKVSLKTPSKKELAELLHAIAEFIKNSANETVSIGLEVTFNVKDDC